MLSQRVSGTLLETIGVWIVFRPHGALQSLQMAGPMTRLASSGSKPSLTLAQHRQRHPIGACSSCMDFDLIQPRRFSSRLGHDETFRSCFQATPHMLCSRSTPQIFGALTASYRRSSAGTAEHMDSIDRAQFGNLYARVRKKVLTQVRARKAFSDCGITVNPSPEKVLNRLTGVLGQSETPQRPPLHELNGRSTVLALKATINAMCPEPVSRDTRNLKRTAAHTFEVLGLSHAVLQAENIVLRAHQ